MLSTQCVLVIILLPGGGETAESTLVLTQSLNEPHVFTFGPEPGDHNWGCQDPPGPPGLEDLQSPGGLPVLEEGLAQCPLSGGMPRSEDAQSSLDCSPAGGQSPGRAHGAASWAWWSLEPGAEVGRPPLL